MQNAKCKDPGRSYIFSFSIFIEVSSFITLLKAEGREDARLTCPSPPAECRSPQPALRSVLRITCASAIRHGIMRCNEMALQAGTSLGTYEVLSPIGAGGMGEVYRARDTRLGREVAIKVLPADRIADADRRRRFVQEAQAASALNHPHIVTIYEIESADGNDFIVMEYVRGKSLDALIPRQGMRLNEALRIAIAVADAPAAAHARGIIHRDLKPANVIVGTDGTVKVLDFGLAKLMVDADTPEEDSPTLTSHALVSAPGTIAGTAAYMAPEQATGGTVDARTDIFSFGAMLYEMVTGSRAFPGSSTADTLSAVIRAQPTPPSAVVAIPGDLEKIILRCLRKDPQRRYQHIGDVKVALQDVKEESESGVTASASVRRTHRRGPIAALVAAALVIAGATAWLLLPLHRRPQRRRRCVLWHSHR
jgi:serine/threonine protein kinase